MSLTQTDNQNFVEGLFTHYADEVWLKGKRVVRLQACVDDAANSFLDVSPDSILMGAGEPKEGPRIRLNPIEIHAEVGDKVINVHRKRGIELKAGAFVVKLGAAGFTVEVGPNVLSLSEAGLNVLVGTSMVSLTAAGLNVEAPLVDVAAEGACNVEGAAVNVAAEGALNVMASMTTVL